MVYRLSFVVLVVVGTLAGCAAPRVSDVVAPIEERSQQRPQTPPVAEPPPSTTGNRATTPSTSTTVVALPQGRDAAPNFEALPAPGAQSPEIKAAPLLRVESEFESVKALALKAELEQRNAQNTQAIATIERALRIEPGNPYLWHRLAVAQYLVGDYDAASANAERSNASANDQRLRAANWRVVLDAATATGNEEMARRARGNLSHADQ